jgi:CHAD domain-containing protein
MSLGREALDLPAARIARAEARAMLVAAGDALARLESPGDTEALHDARVALRRLRGWLRAFDAELELPDRIRRRLRRLARATGEARDLEVAVERVEELALQAAGPRRALIGALGRELARERNRGRAPLRLEVARRWAAVGTDLERELSGEVEAIAPRFGTACAAQVAAASAPFALPPPKAGDWAALHALRIAGKRVRYLIEPLREARPEVASLLVALKALQEHLGSVNDAVVLEELLAAHAARAARSATLDRRTLAAARATLGRCAAASEQARAWRDRLARRHRHAVALRLPELHRACARLVAVLRSERPRAANVA